MRDFRLWATLHASLCARSIWIISQSNAPLVFSCLLGGKPWLCSVAMTRWLYSTSFRPWSFSSSFSAHTTLRFKDCTDWHGVRRLQGQTMWNNVNLTSFLHIDLARPPYCLWANSSRPLGIWSHFQHPVENSNIEPVCRIKGNYRVAEVILWCLSCHIGIPFWSISLFCCAGWFRSLTDCAESGECPSSFDFGMADARWRVNSDGKWVWVKEFLQCSIVFYFPKINRFLWISTKVQRKNAKL